MSSNVTELNNPERARLGCVLAVAIERGQTEASERELDLVAALFDCQHKALTYRHRIKRLMLELAALRQPATDEEIDRSFDAYR